MKVSFLAMAALLASEGISPAFATVDDPRAKDGIDLFRSFCVSTDGTRDRALAVLADGNALANRLPASVAEASLHQPGAIGWALKSPSGASLMLAYAANGHCEVRIEAADEEAVVSQYESLAARYPASRPSDTLGPEIRADAGVRRTTRGFAVRRDAFLAAVLLSTLDKPYGDQQHLITFDVQAK